MARATAVQRRCAAADTRAQRAAACYKLIASTAQSTAHFGPPDAKDERHPAPSTVRPPRGARGNEQQMVMA